MSFWKWSRAAANNATADGSINWAQGQAPSMANDSARAQCVGGIAAAQPDTRMTSICGCSLGARPDSLGFVRPTVRRHDRPFAMSDRGRGAFDRT
jgi:hypothetical protein